MTQGIFWQCRRFRFDITLWHSYNWKILELIKINNIHSKKERENQGRKEGGREERKEGKDII